MEAYYLSSSSSSSSYTYDLSLSDPQERKSRPNQPHPFHSSLHSVRKPAGKPWKKPVAPLPPTPTRVYKVNPINFKEVVQKLTGATEFQSRRLQSVAPPPLNLAAGPSSLSNNDCPEPLQLLSSLEETPLSAAYRDLASDQTLDTKPRNLSDSFSVSSSLGISLSPSSWCSFPLLSPGTLSTLERSTVI